MREILIDSIFCFLDTFIITYFIESLFKRRGLSSIASLIPVFIILLFADIGITFFKAPILIQLAVFIVLCGFVLIVFYDGDILKKLYTVIFTILLTIIPSLLIVYIVSWVSNVNYATLINKNDSLKIATNLLSKFCQFLTIKIVLINFKKEKSNTSKPQIVMYASIMFFSILAIIFTRDSLQQGAINTDFCVYVTLAIIVVDLVLCSLIYFYSELNRKKIDIKMQEFTIQQQQRDIDNIIKDYNETLKIRHDLKKYLNIAVEMMEEKEYDKLEEYIKSFQDNKIRGTRIYVNTQNKMFNAIINQKMNEAENLNIKVECTICDDLSDFKGMEDIELCLIFLNLLDNAIEAEKNVKNPVIRFHVFKNTGYACFKVENVVEQDVLALNPKLKTTKSDKKVHGIGLKSVREIIEQHDGIFNITQDGKWFIAEIMLLKSAF
ncbi:sensor histidine kinase [Ruminococcus sp.]|uniref:sensor histidine kinase n=1 Tax=Ruminococcus sp. TaxID=41978 RepID=UPI001B7406E6|nr:sensor histidine kinase [Ruminococcus sp.]MBP5431419.1 GHKL domain-containing protein [Ruminococcus sp.]